MDSEEKERLALDEKTSPEILEELSRDKLWYIRCCVAANPSTPKSGLEILSKDEDHFIRADVARHPSTPERALIRLSKDRYRGVSVIAIRHNNSGILREMTIVGLDKEEDLESKEEKLGRNRLGRNRLSWRLLLPFLVGWQVRYFDKL